MKKLITLSGWVVALMVVLLTLDLRFWHVITPAPEHGAPPSNPGVAAAAPTPAAFHPLPANGASNSLSTITMVCRAVSLEKATSGADSGLAYGLVDELKKSPLIRDVQLSPDLKPDDASGTFNFTLTLVMKRPPPLSGK
jgi:hypothetical protein